MRLQNGSGATTGGTVELPRDRKLGQATTPHTAPRILKQRTCRRRKLRLPDAWPIVDVFALSGLDLAVSP